MAADIQPVNYVEMDRKKLVDVLEYFGYRVGEHFSHSIRLVVHGGACMLLHPGLHHLAKQQAEMTPEMKIRKTTRDVDYIHRAFVQEWTAYGEPDAPSKLQTCIRETAVKFGLGADWMNSAADVALPMATDPHGRQYDPIFTASIQPENVRLHTIFSSANGMLDLVSVAPFWAVALKLVRYAKWDASDVCLLLKYGIVLSPGMSWTTDCLERWIKHHCWTMGYDKIHPQQQLELRRRIKHAITMVSEWYAKTPTLEEFLPTGFRTEYSPGSGNLSNTGAGSQHQRIHVSRESVMGTKGLDRDQAAWGGDDRSGWKASFAGDWVKPNASPPPPTHSISHIQSPPEQAQQQYQHSQQPSYSLPHLYPQNQPLMALDSVAQPSGSSNVADWIAEEERRREKRERKQERRRARERERERERERSREQEVVEPFVPPLYPLDDGTQPRGRDDGQQLGHHRRAMSQPPIPPELHSQMHYAPPQPVVSPQRQSVPKSAKSHGSLHSFMVPMNAYPIPHPTQQEIPQHPWNGYSYNYYVTPTNVVDKGERKERGKRRDKARDKARTAKKWRQDYTIAPDGSYIVSLWRESPKSKDEKHPEPSPSHTPSQPVIYPLTDVVYYNQAQAQQQQQQQSAHTSPPQPPPQSSPPYPPQIYRQPMTSMVPQPWAHAMSSAQIPPHMPVSMSQASPHILAPARVSSQPVIPPEEYMRDDRPAGTLQKLMSALKIS